MRNRLLYLMTLVICVSLFASCKDDDEVMNTKIFNLNISGLENLGAGYAYEGWLIVDGNPISSGVFTVNNSGSLSKTSFEVDKSDLETATTFVLTLEPSPDNDPAPSKVHILAGDFTGTNASLAISHGAALNSTFLNIAGKYILATPTDGMGNNENSGIWFLDLVSGNPATGLTLPALPEGWAYEGWAVINGIPVSTGVFTSASGADQAASYSGTMSVPPFPGEDFLTNAPGGLVFPTDISGGIAVISIEPVPDNSANPFLLKPLLVNIPANALDHTPYPMNQNLVFPMGSVTR
ncbi:MAG: anti-sigma factor [Saprospiraceae bacterium]